MLFENVRTPCYICEEELLENNLKLLDYVQKSSGAKIILALKGFAMWSTFPIVKRYLQGATASGLHEAKLARDFLNKEVHTYSPAFPDEDIDEVIAISDHIVFNSFNQWQKFKPKIEEAKANGKKIDVGLRVNPEYSEIEVPLYNPCSPFSRLGIIHSEFKEELLDGIDGLHFHTHCEQNSDALMRTIPHFEEHFGKYIPNLKWVNFGGGHHITRSDYDVELLIKVIKEFKERHNNIDVYLEPGEAVGWQTGILIASVLDIVHNGMNIAILDTSAEAHMPDTLAMPYRPMVRNSGEAGEKKYNYRFAGNTCLAGDIIGDYSFDEPLEIGDKVIFEDQIHYTMVKTTTFNGIRLPSIALFKKNGELKIIKDFGYEDYKNRLS